MFYDIISFDMDKMKNSMHSRIDTKTMKQVHCFEKRYYCSEQYFQAFCASPTTIFCRCPYAGKLVTCQQQFAQLHHVVLKHRRYKDVGVSASAVGANVT